MPLVYICDFCGKPITTKHYAFTVQSRVFRDTSDLPVGVVQEAPLLDVDKNKVYVVHGNHFDDDPGGVAQALYYDFNEIKPPEPEPEPDPPPPADPADLPVADDSAPLSNDG